MTWAVCYPSFPRRPWRGMFHTPDHDPVPDRSYWHPCTKGHVAQCRGSVGRVPLNASHGVCWWLSDAKWVRADLPRLVQINPHGCQNAVFTPRLCGQRTP